MLRSGDGSVVPVFSLAATNAELQIKDKNLSVVQGNSTKEAQNYFVFNFYFTAVLLFKTVLKPLDWLWKPAGHPSNSPFLSGSSYPELHQWRETKEVSALISAESCLQSQTTSGEWINLFWSCEKSMFVCHTQYSTKGLGILSLMISKLLLKSEGFFFWKQMELWRNFDLQALHQCYSYKTRILIDGSVIHVFIWANLLSKWLSCKCKSSRVVH